MALFGNWYLQELRVRGRLSLASQPAKLTHKPGWGRMGSWSEAVRNSLPQTREAPSLSRGQTGSVQREKRWRE